MITRREVRWTREANPGMASVKVSSDNDIATACCFTRRLLLTLKLSIPDLYSKYSASSWCHSARESLTSSNDDRRASKDPHEDTITHLDAMDFYEIGLIDKLRIFFETDVKLS